MPTSPEVVLEEVQAKVITLLQQAGAKGDLQAKIEPVAFGIKQLLVYAMFETTDDGNDYDTMSNDIAKIEGVGGANVEKVDLAMG